MDRVQEDIADAILALVLDPEKNDAQASTIREYLTKLLLAVWIEQEGFSGKRPFGNSDWAFDIYVPMVRAGLIAGDLDEDGCLDVCDYVSADAWVEAAIRRICGAA